MAVPPMPAKCPDVLDMPSSRFSDLVGLELTIARVTGDMAVFGFGPVRPTARGGTVGSLALHLQCAWRIASGLGVLTGNADMWTYAGAGARPEIWEPAFGNSLMARRLDTLLGTRLGAAKAYYYASGVHVTEAHFEQTTGDVVIELSSRHRLSVLPKGSSGEQWRLFLPGDDTWHLEFAFPDATESR